MKTFLLKTIGCKTNQYETQLLREQFIKNGYTETLDDDKVDVCVVNTCTVTKRSDQKSRNAIYKLIRENPKAKIIVTGCAVSNESSRIKDIDGVDFFISNKDKAFVKIQDGCNNFCSYCIVPFMRGKPRSRDINEIKEEVEHLIANGYKEIILTGIHLGFFGQDIGSSLLSLIDTLTSIKNLGRLRLSSLDPQEINLPLIDRIKSNSKLCKHLHISIQSADDKILKLMNRRYTKMLVRDLIENLIKEIKDIGISADFIVGFPHEDKENFKNTLNLVKDYDFVKPHVFTYSDREMTAAYNFSGKVDQNVKKERALELKDASRKSAMRFRKHFLNKTLNVLIERKSDKKTGFLTGYADNYMKVLLVNGQESCKSKILPTKITCLKDNFVLGRLEEEDKF